MFPNAQKAEMLHSLGKVVKGLSVLFWSLPITVLVCVKTATSDLLNTFGILPPLVTTAMLSYGLWQLTCFQKQERVWNLALDRVKLLSIANVGLSPFVFWWNEYPSVQLYQTAVGILMLSSLLFLFNLNQAMGRLAAMLPDETLRLETQFFVSLNLYLLVGLVAVSAVFLALQEINILPGPVIDFLVAVDTVKHVLLVFLILLPLAMTMTMIWKIKEVIFGSVFESES